MPEVVFDAINCIVRGCPKRALLLNVKMNKIVLLYCCTLISPQKSGTYRLTRRFGGLSRSGKSVEDPISGNGPLVTWSQTAAVY